MQRSEQINELAAALAKAQGQMCNAPKDGAIASGPKRYRYATLGSIWDACRPALAGNALAVTQDAEVGAAGIKLTTLLMHASGQFVCNELVMPMSERSEKGVGQAMTYARKYALAALVGVAPDDDEPSKPPSGQPGPSAEVLAECQRMIGLLNQGSMEMTAYLSRVFNVTVPTALTQFQAEQWRDDLRKGLAARGLIVATDTTPPSTLIASPELPAGGAPSTLQEALAAEQRAGEANGAANGVDLDTLHRNFLSALESFLGLRFPDTGNHSQDNINRNSARKAILDKYPIVGGGPDSINTLRAGCASLEKRVAELVEQRRLEGVTCAVQGAPAAMPGGKS